MFGMGWASEDVFPSERRRRGFGTGIVVAIVLAGVAAGVAAPVDAAARPSCRGPAALASSLTLPGSRNVSIRGVACGAALKVVARYAQRCLAAYSAQDACSLSLQGRWRCDSRIVGTVLAGAPSAVSCGRGRAEDRLQGRDLPAAARGPCPCARASTQTASRVGACASRRRPPEGELHRQHRCGPGGATGRRSQRHVRDPHVRVGAAQFRTRRSAEPDQPRRDGAPSKRPRRAAARLSRSSPDLPRPREPGGGGSRRGHQRPLRRVQEPGVRGGRGWRRRVRRFGGRARALPRL